MTREQRIKEINELLDLHPEMCDQILRLLRENESALATNQEPHQGAD